MFVKSLQEKKKREGSYLCYLGGRQSLLCVG
jgi:hypothetical protein